MVVTEIFDDDQEQAAHAASPSEKPSRGRTSRKRTESATTTDEVIAPLTAEEAPKPARRGRKRTSQDLSPAPAASSPDAPDTGMILSTDQATGKNASPTASKPATPRKTSRRPRTKKTAEQLALLTLAQPTSRDGDPNDTDPGESASTPEQAVALIRPPVLDSLIVPFVPSAAEVSVEAAGSPAEPDSSTSSPHRRRTAKSRSSRKSSAATDLLPADSAPVEETPDDLIPAIKPPVVESLISPDPVSSVSPENRPPALRETFAIVPVESTEKEPDGRESDNLLDTTDAADTVSRQVFSEAPDTVDAVSDKHRDREPSEGTFNKTLQAEPSPLPAENTLSPEASGTASMPSRELSSQAAAESSETETEPAPLPAAKPRSRSARRRAAAARRKAEAAAREQDILAGSEETEATPQDRQDKTTDSPVQNSASEESRPGAERKMLVSVLPDELVEVVILEDNLVAEYYVEMVHQAKIRGNIYKGVVSNIDPNLQAAFVNFGGAKNGFLQIDEIHPEYWLTHHDPEKGGKYPPIQKVMKAGQEVLVQVVKEPNGSKGAFLTTWVSLAGRFLVLTPGQEQIGISRKVEDGEERNRLRELIKGLNPGEGLGAIVRTVSAGTSKTTLQKDLSYLKRVWKDIHKRAGTEKAPCLIYEEPGLASRAVRDYLSDDVTEVWVDDPATAESMRSMTSMLFPRRGNFVHLYDNPAKSMWEFFNVRRQLEQVHAREVTLPSGGRLVFDQTEALMAIDINSGKSGGKNNFEATALRTNMEAAESIARQLRLRDVGGQIVIDFIEMRDQNRCREVERTLHNAMKNDRARHDIGHMSSFGLLQIVRQRIGSSAISISQEPCPHCHGTGLRRNMEWQALQLLRELRSQMRLAARNGQTEYVCPLGAELAVYVLNHKRERLGALEKEFHLRLEIRIAPGEA